MFIEMSSEGDTTGRCDAISSESLRKRFCGTSCRTFTCFSKLSLKITKRTFLVLNLRIFIFARNFLKLSTQNYTNKAFFVSKLRPFVFHYLPFHKSEGTDSNYKDFFKDFSLKISTKEHFLSQI